VILDAGVIYADMDVDDDWHDAAAGLLGTGQGRARAARNGGARSGRRCGRRGSDLAGFLLAAAGGPGGLVTVTDRRAVARARRQYDAYAARYDRETGWYERIMLANGRIWACRQARGAVLEVAIGTGRNLPFYLSGIRLVGLDLSVGMLALAHHRARELAMRVDLLQGDAQAMPFANAAFDTVVCTLGLSSVSDDRAAVAEMHRVLRPGGRVVLLGHVVSPYRPIRVLQRMIERVGADHQRPADAQTRQVIPLLREAAFTVTDHHRSRGGIIQRLVATKP
jgi:ubiquinone/menaquinone biosynthesis C-methylase UbiE